MSDRDLVKDVRQYLRLIIREKYGNEIGAFRDYGDDLIVYVRNKDAVADNLKKKCITCFSMLCITIRAYIEEGGIGHRYYRIKVTLDLHIPTEAAIK